MIESSVIKGYGIHSGEFCEVRLHREAGPVHFLRSGVRIPATLESVIATTRCTVLAKDHAQVAMVEHLLAALHVCGWWRDLCIEVSGPELPILDGSAAPWLELIDALGQPHKPPTAWFINQSQVFDLGHSRFSLQAGNRLTVSIDFDHPAIGQQMWTGTQADYHEVLAARTFGFLKELEELRRQGLASQAGLENAIVFGDAEALQQLRYDNEPVRHKALDALGDFFLLGQPITGQLHVHKGSHASHIAFLKHLRSSAA